MQVNCILRSGLLFVTLSLAIARRKQSSFAESCYPRGTLSQAVDTLYVKAARLKATIPEDRIKNIQLLKKKTKKLFMKNCRFQEQLLSFFMEDVFGRLQLQACKETDFVEDFHSLRQKLSRCVSMHSKYDFLCFIAQRDEIHYQDEKNLLWDWKQRNLQSHQ
ncbi:interleukin-26 isoform X2 [Phacochoerus africanus]|uniref:interleukin-26 isoform X2 n=1 Tax=Phacochoerus africanus TaxID=41426 RepID=UPI001FD8AF2A|nr:interleukin-26 isoform X2 [Phacochoerus africanus]